MKFKLIFQSVLLTFLLTLPKWGGATTEEEKSEIPFSIGKLDSRIKKELLKKSHISYKAESQTTGVKSFSVILSCVNGRVSLMKTLLDPDFHTEETPLRQIGHLDQAAYLQLWSSLLEQHLMEKENQIGNAFTDPDGFRIHFYATIGEKRNQFQAHLNKGFEVTTYSSIQRLIDNTVDMASLWQTYFTSVRY